MIGENAGWRTSTMVPRCFYPAGAATPDFLLAVICCCAARQENTGTVLLEALVAGLPLLVTEVCGYAHHVLDAECGLVSPEPFDQQTFNGQLAQMLGDDSARLPGRPMPGLRPGTGPVQPPQKAQM